MQGNLTRPRTRLVVVLGPPFLAVRPQAKGVLRIGSCGVELPFLAEGQIPLDFSAHVEDVSEAEANRRMESGKGARVVEGGVRKGGLRMAETGYAAWCPQPVMTARQPC
jgi:hypothetical protein